MTQETARDQLYAKVVDAFTGYPDVTLGSPGKRGFGESALQVKGKIFAMMDSKGEFVVKLPAGRVSALIAAGEGRNFDSGRGRPMKEWLVVERDSEDAWLSLAREAMAFVASKL